MVEQDPGLMCHYSIKKALEEGKISLGPVEKQIAAALLIKEIEQYQYRPTKWQRFKNWLDRVWG